MYYWMARASGKPWIAVHKFNALTGEGEIKMAHPSGFSSGDCFMTNSGDYYIFDEYRGIWNLNNYGLFVETAMFIPDPTSMGEGVVRSRRQSYQMSVTLRNGSWQEVHAVLPPPTFPSLHGYAIATPNPWAPPSDVMRGEAVMFRETDLRDAARQSKGKLRRIEDYKHGEFGMEMTIGLEVFTGGGKNIEGAAEECWKDYQAYRKRMGYS